MAVSCGSRSGIMHQGASELKLNLSKREVAALEQLVKLLLLTMFNGKMIVIAQ